MVSSKSLLLFGLGLFAGVQACIVVDGMVSDGLSTQFEVDLTDDGTKTCTFTCSGAIDDCTGDCNHGYSAKAKTGYDFNTGGPLVIDYSTPHGDYSVSVENTSHDCMNCCGGTIPCTCCQNKYGGSFFGC
ncbi:hypothetical protein BGW36DRAFT_421627 [Talaromyces proteolyticus]|uniref:Uncharacterized protein n=1 Tax=Talaromyces proteolyticus TaxID=1131652 RepID=A0AAD4L5N6_9EURO|nr:uncharacterized protein BGW36DRAFT_421627 [Talaromyces proteolyticus]KAH8705050.1 hypothetical protein BGW36DRAFT_421627 [Talaromyces proteolyticus]